MTNYRTIYVTCSDKKEAAEIGKQLVEKKLVACANIWDNITSIYKWEGAICEESECALLLKTNDKNVNETIKRIKELHSYEVPNVSCWEIVGGNAEYFEWIDNVTQ